MYRTIYNSVQIQLGAPCTARAIAEHVTAARRFPAPWKAEKMPGGYVVRDANGQALAHVDREEIMRVTWWIVMALITCPSLVVAQSNSLWPYNRNNSSENSSPNNWRNSPNNWNNSSDNWNNSPNNWRNSPNNWNNLPYNMNSRNGLYDGNGNRTGYVVRRPDGGANFFDNDGNRRGYMPGRDD